MRYAISVPELRPAVLDELAEPGLDASDTTFLAWRTRLHERIDELPPGAAIVLGYARSLAAVVRDPPAVLEVSEPLWYKAWPRTVVLVWIARAAGRVQRRRVRVTTYAIENLSIDEGLRISRGTQALRPVHRPLERAARVLLDLLASVTIEQVAFGTRSAQLNYEAALPRLMRRAEVHFAPVEPVCCARCFPAGGTVAADREVLFLGDLSVRKGVDLLLAAWPSVVAHDPGWRLRLVGTGELASAAVAAQRAAQESVLVEHDLSRAEVHHRLARAAIVVLPSRRVPGWREQVGLPVLEGLCHGCSIVTTTETGLAEDLRRGGHVVTEPDSLPALASAMSRCMQSFSGQKVLPSAASGSEGLRGDRRRSWLTAT